MQNSKLQDFRQNTSDSGQMSPYPSNNQEIAESSLSVSTSDSDVCLTNTAQSRNPKEAQVLPKTNLSDLAENGDIVSIYFKELSELISAWPMLSNDVRAGILAMIRITSKKNEEYAKMIHHCIR